MPGARKRSAAWAGPLLAAFLVADDPAAAARRSITGKLSQPGYTVIALADNGKARSVRATTRPFRLVPPAGRVTLHLRAADGTYAGPIMAGVRRGRAVVGFRAGAALGLINVRRGYARVVRGPSSRAVDTTRLARARRGVPIGARVFGRVRSKPPRGSPSADRDVDGVPSVLDIDDDGDLVLDSVDYSRAARAAQDQATVFGTHTDLSGSFETTVNANAGSTDQQIAAALPAFGRLDVQILPGDSSELDCGRPQVRTDPTVGGLVYCSRGGTGRVFQPSVPEASWPRFPECCDADGDGFGTLSQTAGVPGAMFIATGATAAQIGTGDVLIQRVTTGGLETQFLTALQYVFATMPALVSYNDGAGNSRTVSYPVQRVPGPPGCSPACTGPASGDRGNGFPVKARPNGDVIVRLTFWRPQRRPIAGETGNWIDIGGLHHTAGIDGIDSSCAQSAFSAPSPGLTPIDIEVLDRAGFRDLAADQPASAANTFAYTLNLTQCLRSPVSHKRPAPGFSFNPGEERGLKFSGISVSGNNTGEAEQSIYFTRQ
jgi:hypothetical protein